VHTSILTGLGPALRWLRDRRGRKQYEVANAAGITKGMLSAYETGRQRPSLDTLDKVLETLGCDLNDLHNSLRIVNGEPAGLIRSERRAPWPSLTGGGQAGRSGSEGEVDVYDALGITERLPEQEEKALTEMLQGFHRLLRFFHLGTTEGPRPADGEEGHGGHASKASKPSDPSDPSAPPKTGEDEESAD
jgi:transcriptional regulator with XRE-family HTH domain